jgi:hypothetical protein
MKIKITKAGTYVFMEELQEGNFLIILYVKKISRNTEKIKFEIIRPHKSFELELLPGRTSLGIIEALSNYPERFKVSLLEYNEKFIKKEDIFDKYPEYLI